jgi:voltage-gated potassium channel
MASVGYGELPPQTDLGRFIASVMMLVGWGIIAILVGIVTAEVTPRRFDHRQTNRI